ncbi:MAG TPA: rhomboid family intramembrane serine protease [Vicinamibacterales bacterium]|nr:rhomboid family intramembrane serine protease [Vicinamibacterales bacterium]
MIPLRDVIPTRTTPWVTLSLVALNVAVFGRWVLVPADDPYADAFLFRWGLVAADRWWPGVVTSLFVHTSLLHLGTNVLALWIYGENVEDRLGHGRFLLLYLATGALAAGADALLAPAGPVLLTGANGAIAGVMGAYLILFPRSKVLVLVPLIVTRDVVEISALFVVCAWLAVQVMGDFVHPVGTFPRLAIGLHGGGLAAGTVLVLALRRRARERVEWWGG